MSQVNHIIQYLEHRNIEIKHNDKLTDEVKMALMTENKLILTQLQKVSYPSSSSLISDKPQPFGERLDDVLLYLSKEVEQIKTDKVAASIVPDRLYTASRRLFSLAELYAEKALGMKVLYYEGLLQYLKSKK